MKPCLYKFLPKFIYYESNNHCRNKKIVKAISPKAVGVVINASIAKAEIFSSQNKNKSSIEIKATINPVKKGLKE